MKIALLTRYYDMRNAGIGRVSFEVLKGLLERGHFVTPISDAADTIPGYFKYCLYGIRNKIPKGCQVYHALTPGESLWLPKDKSVVTIYDMILTAHPERAGATANKSKYNRFMGQLGFKIVTRAAARCRHIITISDESKNDIVYYLNVPPEKVSVVRLGIPEYLRPERYRHNGYRIGYLGQLDHRKRVELLINAFHQTTSNDLELVIAGIGVDEKKLRELAGDDERIHFIGFVPEDRLNDFYNCLDLFVFPTAMEGYGLPLVEAMACKIPVVVLDDAIIPLDVKNRCCVVSKNALPEVLNGNVKFMADLNSNFQFAREHSWNKCVEAYEGIYEKMS